MHRTSSSVLLLAFLIAGVSAAEAPSVWTPVEELSIESRGDRTVFPRRYQTLSLDLLVLETALALAPTAGSAASETARVLIDLPFPDGTSRVFQVEESSILAPELAARYPELRTYRGRGLDDPATTARLGLTPRGFHATVYTPSGTIWLDPYQRGDVESYIVYYQKDFTSPEPESFTCGVGDVVADLGLAPHLPKAGGLPSNGDTLRRYRLAVAANGEYTAFHSAGTPTVAEGLAAIVVAMNRINGIFERDLSLTMELVADNDQIVYTDAATDPFTGSDVVTLLNQTQATIDSVIGDANYDIGHLFNTLGGGVAFVGVPCTTGSKAHGLSGRSSPETDPFWVAVVSHELGHQWGARHTWNAATSVCSGFNYVPETAYEPGSGSTILSYAGLCGDQNLQGTADDYYHTISLEEMAAYFGTGDGSACGRSSASGNGIPSVDAGAASTLPLETPFELCATGSDPDGDSLTFAWESFTLGPAGDPRDPVGDAPIFRSWPPRESPCRTFPRIEDLLTGSETIGELLPTYARTLVFRITARDNRSGGGAFATDQVEIEVTDSAGPFALTSPDTAVTWQGGTLETITWDVAGTDLPPVSCAAVDLLLSDDGGLSFPHELALGTGNDGSQSVVVPQIDTATARVKVACSDNLFFDLSGADFEILVSPSIFADGFESGDTSAWSTASP